MSSNRYIFLRNIHLYVDGHMGITVCSRSTYISERPSRGSPCTIRYSRSGKSTKIFSNQVDGTGPSRISVNNRSEVVY